MIAAKPRVGAVVDLLSSIFNPSPSPSIRKTKSSLHKKLPADVIIHGFFKEHRNFGSHDRPFITDTVFSIIRNKSKLSWWIDSSKKKSWQAHILSRNDSKQLTIAYLAIKQKWNRDKIQSCFNEELSEHELKLIDRLQDKPIESEAMPLIVQAECPRILEPLLQDVFRSKFLEEMRAFQQQAPLDLRVNTLKATRDQVKNLLREEGLSSVETPYSTFGLRVQQRSPVLESLDLFKEGLVEIQDEGSQIVAMCTGVTSGNYVLDYCAGAGGKTLAMASMMNNGGRITACDIDESRLMNAKKRLARAGVFNTNVSVLDQTGEIILSRKKGKSDVVLVDAPCTGSGTWRRAPDLKWRLQADDILEYASAQQTILSEASKYVKDGGRLVYTTCSLLKVENEAQISAFLDAPEGKNFEIVPLGELWSSRYPEIASPLPISTKFWRLTPYSHNTDAFFISVLQKSTTK